MQRLMFFMLIMILSGDFLKAAQLPETVVQTGHDAMVSGISLSPDGRFLASCSSGRVSIWDIGTRKQMAIPKFRGDANGVVFLPDSRTVAIYIKYIFSLGFGVKKSTAVIFWDLAAAREVKTFAAETTQNPVSLAVHQGRNIMAVGHGDGALLLYDIRSGEKIRECAGHGKYIKSVIFSPDGSKLYSCSSDKTIRCWDIASGAERYSSPVTREPNSMVLSADGRLLYCSPVHASLSVIEAASGREIRTITQNGSIIDMSISEDNRMLACGTYEGRLNLIDAAAGKTVRSIKAHSRAIKCVAFSPDQTIAYTGSEDQSIGAWDVSSGSRIHSFGGSPVQIARNARYSADGKSLFLSNNEYGPRQWALSTTALSDTPVGTKAKGIMALSRDGSLAAVVSDGSIQLWELTTGRMLKSMGAHASWWSGVAMDLSPDGRRAVSGTFRELRLYDAASGTIKASFPAKGQVQAVRFSPDGKRFLTADPSSNCIIRDSASGAIVMALGSENRYAANAIFSPDGKTVLTKFASTLILWDSKTGNKISETAINHLFQEDNEYLAFSPDGATFLAGGETIGLFETATLKQIRTFSGHRNYIYSAAFHPGGKQFVTASRDGTVRCWDLDSGTWTAFVSGTDPAQWLVFNDEGYWDASARGGDFVAAVKGLDVWNIDQFALRTNRPDLILARFPDADSGFIRHLRAQYERRLRRMNMSESGLSAEFAAPTAAISDLTQKGNSASISANFSAAGKSLQRYQIHINDVPLFGREGKSISGKKASITERIALTGGENKIEVSCMDAGGIESTRALRYVTAEGTPKPDCWFIGFGVSEYRDPAIRDLRYAAKDARDLEAAFRAMAGRGFAQVHTKVLTDAAVTRDAISAAKDFLRGAKPDDTLVLFVSGHGVQAGTPLNYYYITADTRLDDVPGTAAEFDQIESILQGIQPRTKLFLIDTCESGESDDGARRAAASSLAKGLSARTLDAAGIRAISVNRKTAPRRIIQTDRWIYNDLLRRSGAIVLSSCRADESSLESDQWQQGVFTRSVMNALRSRAADRDGNGIVTTDELRSHVMKEVPELVKSLDPNAEQHPTVDRDNIHVRFGFPVIAAP